MREEDIGKLYPMVGLDLLDGEGKDAKQTVKEKDAGLRGEFRADPHSPEAGAIVYGRVEVLLKKGSGRSLRRKGGRYFTSTCTRWPGASMA